MTPRQLRPAIFRIHPAAPTERDVAAAGDKRWRADRERRVARKAAEVARLFRGYVGTS